MEKKCKKVTCDICGNEAEEGELTEFDGQHLCESCLEDETLICTYCEERIWMSENAGDANTPLCQNCYDAYYVSCVRCGRIIHSADAYYEDDEEDDPYCSECWEHHSHDNATIHDYYYKPTPIFHGNDDRYFGVELEIDGAGESSSSAKEILSIANVSEELIYCKHDGSLDDGFEIVTHPMTLDFHHRLMPWKAVMSQAVELGYTSHKARTCGLHVHVNRSTFGYTEEQQDTCIARTLYFFEKHWEELLKFSRRTELQLKRWAARYGYKEQPKEILENAKKGFGGGRYSSVNLQNQDTIEFRIFRGTLKYNTLIATLQLVNKLCSVAIAMSDEELKGLSWTSFVENIKPGENQELVQYLKERRLYINEPVESEVEV